MNRILIPQQTFKNITFPPIKITYDRISDRLTKVFSPVELKEYLSLYERAQSNPKAVEKELQNFKQKHSSLPEVYNLLGYVLIQRKKIKKAEQLIEENYLKNSANLFAKINYADQCLRKNKAFKIPEIFNLKSSLTEIYPSCPLFHFSEVIGFVCLMGFYHLKLNQKELALDNCAYAKLIDSNDHTVLHLEKKLYKRSFIEHFLRALKFYRS